MSAEALLSRLDRVRRTGDGRWLACCPSHPDKSPSLSIRELDDGRVLVHCFAGCSIEEILGATAVDIAELFPPRPIEHGKRERRSFPAADVLRALADEALLVAVAAANLGHGATLSRTDYERLMLAAERIQVGRSLALGRT